MSSTARPDASMDLLRQLFTETVEPEYTRIPKRGRRPSRAWRVGGALAACALITMAAVQQIRAQPVDDAERQQLIAQIGQEQSSVSARQAQAQALRAEVATLQAQILPSASAQQDSTAAVLAGATELDGPGVVVTVADAPQASGPDQQVSDDDLRLLVNGLWQAGAEAIAINGQRLVSTTAIRSAGSAITVNYTSLSEPYRVVALGDRRALPARLATTAGGQRWSYLQVNYGLAWSVDASSKLSVPAAVITGLTHAKAGR